MKPFFKPARKTRLSSAEKKYIQYAKSQWSQWSRKESEGTSMATHFGRHLPDLNSQIQRFLKNRKNIVIHEIGIGAGKWGAYAQDAEPTEPYELMNLARQAGKKAELFAMDINENAVQKARAMRTVNPANVIFTRAEDHDYFRSRFFPGQQQRRRMVAKIGMSGVHKSVRTPVVKIPRDVKARMHFTKGNILTSTPAKKSDLSVCFNVLQYYPNNEKQIIVNNIASAMKKGAYFITDDEASTVLLGKAGLRKIKTASKFPYYMIFKKIR